MSIDKCEMRMVNIEKRRKQKQKQKKNEVKVEGCALLVQHLLIKLEGRGRWRTSRWARPRQGAHTLILLSSCRRRCWWDVKEKSSRKLDVPLRLLLMLIVLPEKVFLYQFGVVYTIHSLWSWHPHPHTHSAFPRIDNQLWWSLVYDLPKLR